jgi:cytochrome bd-type quinol oxidase subunit 1
MVLNDAVSITVPAGIVALSLIVYTIIYAALMVAAIYLLAKFARAGIPESREDETQNTAEDNLSIVGAQD